MKKNVLALIITTACFASSQATAMDLDTKNLKATNSDTNSGWYIGVDAVTGTLAANSYSYGQGDGYGTFYPIQNTMSSARTTGFGVNAGYQDSDIQNSTLRTLQVNRISYGLEFDTDAANLNGTADNGGYPATISANYHSKALFATTKINIFQVWHFSPYVKAGVGIMQQTLSNYALDYSGSDTTFPNANKTSPAFQVGTGIDFFITQHVNASVGYRYLHTNQLALPNQSSQAGIVDAPSFNTNQNQLLASLTYNF